MNLPFQNKDSENQRKTHIQRETMRQKDRERETYIHRESLKDKETEKHIKGQTHRETMETSIHLFFRLEVLKMTTH